MVPLKDYEELRFKLKILEAKRQEDRERLREHEKIKEEAEQFLTLRNKLQGTPRYKANNQMKLILISFTSLRQDCRSAEGCT